MRELLVILAFMAVGASCASVMQDGSNQMSSNTAMLAPGESLRRMGNDWNAVDPDKLLHSALDSAQTEDIVEDEKDPFISTRGGKLRARLVKNAGDEWAETTITKPVLHRVKRCGGGGGGGGGGDGGDGGARRARGNRYGARRTRRSRRTRRTRRNRSQRRATRRAARKAKKRASKKTTTTTVTRKVIQDGQVISQSTVPQQPAVVKTVTTTTKQQPVAVPATAVVTTQA